VAPRAVSSGKRRAEVIAAELRHFAGWKFDVACANCGERRELFVFDLSQRYGARTAGWVAAQLRCSLPRCGGRPSSLILRRGGYEVALIGPGTYG
jgi:hypothetical protein